ncbi:MAG: MaoC family dehydratase, partial [Archangium sp.]|nr:MaoC family dehydratase [Archangium sp.]
TSRVAEISDRPGPAGRVEVAVIEDEGRDEEGQMVFRARRSYVVRLTRES